MADSGNDVALPLAARPRGSDEPPDGLASKYRPMTRAWHIVPLTRAVGGQLRR